MEVVPFITSEDEDPDLVVSFGLGPSASSSGRFWSAAKTEILCASLDITWPEVMVILGVCFAVVGVAAALALMVRG